MKEALVEVDGELAVVDANAQRRVGAEDEEVVFASPFPNLESSFISISNPENKTFSGSERFLTDVKSFADEGPEPVTIGVANHQESWSCDVWVHPAIDGGEAEPVEGGAERPSPGGTCQSFRKFSA